MEMNDEDEIGFEMSAEQEVCLTILKVILAVVMFAFGIHYQLHDPGSQCTVAEPITPAQWLLIMGSVTFVTSIACLVLHFCEEERESVCLYIMWRIVQWLSSVFICVWAVLGPFVADSSRVHGCSGSHLHNMLLAGVILSFILFWLEAFAITVVGAWYILVAIVGFIGGFIYGTIQQLRGRPIVMHMGPEPYARMDHV